MKGNATTNNINDQTNLDLAPLYILCNYYFLRAATAALVEKQSHEMLELINEKRSEYMMAESLYMEGQDETDYVEDLPPYPSHAPIPAPPALSKFQIYSDPAEFASVDQIAISVSFIIQVK